MPKKKINNRLNKLFDNIKSDEPSARPKRAIKTLFQTARLNPDSVPADLVQPRAADTVIANTPVSSVQKSDAAVLSLAFQDREDDWSTLRILDETTKKRIWSEDDQLLVRQVADQLSLALENAHLFQEQQNHAAELQSVSEISSAVTTILDLQTLLENFVDLTRQRFNLYHAHIFILDEDHHALTVKACGWKDESLHGTQETRTIDIDQPVSIVARAARILQPVILNNAREDPTWLLNPSLPDVQSEMAIPVLAQEKLIGILNIHADQLNAFDENDAAIMTTLAAQVGAAIQNTRLFEEIKERNEQLAAVNEIMSSAGQTLEIRSILKIVLEKVLQATNFDGGLITMFNTSRNKLERAVRIGMPGQSPEDPAEGLDESLCKFVFDTQQDLIIPNLALGAPVDVSSEVQAGLHGYIGIPLESKGKALGTLCIFRYANEGIPEKIISLCKIIAVQLGFTIENARLFDESRRFRLGLEGSSDAVFLTDTDGTIVYVNSSFEKIYGYTPQEARGKTPRIIKSGMTPQEQYKQFWGTLLNKGTISGEITNRRKDGQLVPIEGSNSPILDETGNILGFLAVHQDITERKKAEELIRHRNEYLAASSDIGRKITASLELETIFSSTVNLIAERFNLYYTAIFTVEETGQNAVLRDGTGAAGQELKKQKYKLPIRADSLVGNVMSAGEVVISNDVAKDELLLLTYAYSIADLEAFSRPKHILPETHSEAGIPLRVGNRVTGMLDLQSELTNAFHPDDIAVLQTLADQIAIAIDNARSYEELGILNELSSELTKPLSIEDISETVLKFTSQLMGTSSFFICLLNNDKQEMTYPIFLEDGERMEMSSSKPGNGMIEYVIRTNQPLFMPDRVTEYMEELGIDYLIAGTSMPAKCWLGVPMAISNRAFGAIAVKGIHQEHLYTEHQRDLLITIGQQAAISLENSRLYELSQASEANFRNLIENAPEAIIVVDMATGLIADPNENAERLYGFDRQELIKIGLADLSPNTQSDGRPSTEAILEKLIAAMEGDTPIFEWTHKNRQGKLIPCEIHLSRLPGDRPRVRATVVDITGRKLAEEATRQGQEAVTRSEAELRALFSAMNDVIIVLDRQGKYVRIAPTNPSSLFRPTEGMIGKTVREILPSNVQEPMMSAIQEALTTGLPVQLEYWLNIEGQTYWFDASFSRLSEDQVFLVSKNISERKKAEESLRRRDEYLAASSEIGRKITASLELETIFSSAVNLIAERFSLHHTAIYTVEETGFNAVLRDGTGITGQELKKQKYKLPIKVDTLVGNAISAGEAKITNDIAKDELLLLSYAYSGADSEAISKPKHLLPETHSEAGIPLRVGSRVTGALDLQSELTNAFNPDDVAVLQTLADQIAIAIDNARSFQVSQQAVQEMSELDRLKNQFLANMSHELRTPLNSIIGFSRVIIKGIDGPVTELQQQDLTAIYNSGQHLLALINDILDLAKIEAGKMELAFDEVNMSDIINSVLATVAGLIKDKPVTITKNIAPDMPTVRADAIRIRQVLINLFSNAAKFTDEGTITVASSVKTGENNRPEIIVSVTDTGPGIAAEDQAKLFQAFSQVDDSPTRKTGGTGLGLSISQNLIQMHGGQIGVDSVIGKGSTFYFTLPSYRGNPSPNEPQSNMGGKIILAIDDDPQVISLYERYLQPQGYQVIAVTEPSKAKERAIQLKPFAITLDIMMPGIDGWQVLNELKSSAETRNIPVVICSIIEDHEKGFSLGAADYLAKPILEEDLLNALEGLNKDNLIEEILVVQPGLRMDKESAMKRNHQTMRIKENVE